MAKHVISVSVLADTSQFRRAMSDVGSASGLSRLGSIAKDVGRAAAVGLAAAGTAATAVAAKGVSAAADLEQSYGAIDDVFKDYASTAHDYASKASRSVGLSANSYNELATIIGSQLKNGGTSIDQLAGKTNDLITTGADLAAMFGGTTQEAVAALSSALKGERDPIERYGVTLKQASIDAKAAQLGFTDVKDAQAQQAATLALIAEQTTDAAGKFSREANTFAHVKQVATATLEDWAAKIGARLLPTLTTMGTWLVDTGMPAVERFASTVATKASPYLDTASQIITTKVVPAVKEAATWVTTTALPAAQHIATEISEHLGPVLKQVPDLLRDWGPTILTAAATAKTLYEGFKIFQRVKTFIDATRTAFTVLNTVMAANPMVLIAVAVVALIAGLVALYQRCESFRTAVQTAWAAVRDAAAPVVEWFTTTVIPGLKQLWDGLVEVVRAGWELIQAYWEQYGKPVAEFIISVFQGVADQWHTIWDGIQTYWQGLWDVLYAVVSTILGVVHGVITTVTGLITGDWHQAWDGVREIFSSVWEGIKGIVSGALEMIKGWLTAAWGVIKGAASGAWNALKDTVRDTWESVKTNVRTGVDTMISLVKNIPTKIKNLFSDAGHWLTDAGRRVIRGFIDGLKSMWGSVKSTLSRLTDWIPTWKGPAARDAGLLRGAGRAIIGGLVAGLEDRYSTVRASLASLTSMIAGTDLGSLDLPTTTLTGTGTTTTAPVTVNITIQGGLDTGPEIGRRVEQALTSWWAIRGRRPSVTWGMA